MRITAAPITAAPITAAPITAAPITAAPITAAPITDEELAARAREGDGDAVAELYRRHRRSLLAVCTAVAGADGEDALQLLMLDLPRRLSTYDPARGRLRPWLTTVARRQALRTARRRAGGPAPHALDADPTELAAPPTDDPVRRVAARAQLVDLLGRVDGRTRDVLVATCVEGRDDRAVAAELGIDPVTVRTIRSRARARLSREVVACG